MMMMIFVQLRACWTNLVTTTTNAYYFYYCYYYYHQKCDSFGAFLLLLRILIMRLFYCDTPPNVLLAIHTRKNASAKSQTERRHSKSQKKYKNDHQSPVSKSKCVLTRGLKDVSECACLTRSRNRVREVWRGSLKFLSLHSSRPSFENH